MNSTDFTGYISKIIRLVEGCVSCLVAEKGKPQNMPKSIGSMSDLHENEEKKIFAQKVWFVVVCHNARTKRMLLYISFQKIKNLLKKEL